MKDRDAVAEPGAIARWLAQSPVFSKAGIELLEDVAQDAELVRLKTRQHLFFKGDVATHFYLITEGMVHLYRPSYTGNQKIFRTVERGDLLVETAMFLEPAEYPLSAQSVGNSRCYRIRRERLLKVCSASPEFSMAMLGEMAERISQSLNRIDLLTVGNAAQRLVLYLLDMYAQQGSAWLNLPLSQSVLSRQLNITAETLSRQLSGFRRAGLIGEFDSVASEGGVYHTRLVLLDVAGLCRAVDLPPPDTDFCRPSRRLGNSLFDCCNYAKTVLGKRS